MDAALQLLKAGRLAFVVERDDLAVEDDGRLEPPRPLLERGDEFRELAAFFVAEARLQPHWACRIDLGDGADAVVFGLVDELRILERGVDERCQHRAERRR